MRTLPPSERLDVQPEDPSESQREEYQSGLPFPSSGGLLNPGIEPRSPALQAGSLPSEPPGKLKNFTLKGL